MVPDIARHWGRTTPDKVALTDGRTSVTYSELNSQSNRIAQALISHGVQPGDRIGYVGPNSIDFWLLWLGTNKAGAIFVPLNGRFAVPEFVALADDAGVSLVFADVALITTMREVSDTAAEPFVVITLGTEAGPGNVGQFLAEWIEEEPEDDPQVPISVEDTSLLAYTSGTTGRPKSAQVSHQALNTWFMMASVEPTEEVRDDDVYLMVMPNFHLAGSWLTLSGIYHGNTIAILGQFSPTALFEAVTTMRPTIMCLVPTAISMIVHHPDVEQTDFGSVRRILYAGSAISADTIRAALRYLDCELEQFYGTTETYIITILRPDAHTPEDPTQLSSCGSPYPFVDVRVIGADGADVEIGTVGEVLVRSPIMIREYWDAPDATADAFSGEWYRTGDLGRRDDSGNLHLVDRAKDMIVTGGENVYSVEVERALNSHPAVEAAAVLGTPSDQWGEQVTAFVVVGGSAAVTEDELITHCRSQIAGYKVPKAISFLDGLPTTPSGKVRKNVLRDCAVPSPGSATNQRTD